MNCYKFKDIYLGLSSEFKIKITEEMMNSFAEMSGDINPLHLDEEYAKKHGFNSRVVYGMLTSTFYSTLVGVYLPGWYCLLHAIEVGFHKPLYVNNIITIYGAVSYINEAYQQIEIKAYIKDSEDQIVSKAKIKVGLNE